MILGLDFSIAIGFILMLGFVIIVHEFGHFIGAKMLKMRVDEFSIGFGPKLIGFKKGETLYKIAPIIFGGYVKIYGMEEGELDEPERAFYKRPKIQRLIVLAMGAIFNIVSAYFLLCGVYMAGVMERTYLEKKPVIMFVNDGSPAQRAGLREGDEIISINGKPMKTWKHVQDEVLVNPNQLLNIRVRRNEREMEFVAETAKITSHEVGYLGAMPTPPFEAMEVKPGSPAEKAGIQKGDIIYAINGEVMIDAANVVAAISNNAGKEVIVSVLRNGKKMSLKVVPENVQGRGMIGVSFNPYIEVRKYGLQSFKKAAIEVANNVALIFVVIKKLITGTMSLKTLSGPIDLARVSGSAYRSGATVFLMITALISINLGVINLLPIPMLDGGHIFVMLIEWLLRREFSIKLKERIATVGMVLLLLLMVLIIYFDILKIIK
jgi:regulator of sigma E protease